MSKDQIQYTILVNDPDGMRYMCLKDYTYHSKVFNRSITVPAGRKSDGATGARDLGAVETGWRKYWSKGISWLLHHYLKARANSTKTAAWFVHDELCIKGCWDDGTRISNFVCSMVLSIILHTDGYWVESYTWFPATFLFGGGKARKNGMFWVT